MSRNIVAHENIISACNALGLNYDCISAGPTTAKIAIVGDYPGKTEKATGIPFSGEIGNKLWKKLNKFGLTKANVYVTNAIKVMLSDNQEEDITVDANRLMLWKEVLETELGALPNLEYILCLGNNPLGALGEKKGISHWRGSVLPWRNAKCFFANNPAFVFKKNRLTKEPEDPLREVIFNMDLVKFSKLLAGKYSHTEVTCNVIKTISEFEDFLSILYSAQTNSVPISIDIEHLNAHTSCVGFSTDGKTGYVIPFFNQQDNLFTIEEEIQIRSKLSDIISNPKSLLVGQYVSTDLCWLRYKDRIGFKPRVYGDTLLAHHLLYPTFPHSLEFLVSQYTWHYYYKDEGFKWKISGNIQGHWEYNAKDSALTWRIHNALLSELKRENMLETYQGHILRLFPHLVDANATGLPIDLDMKQKLDIEYEDLQTTNKFALIKSIIEQYYEELVEQFNVLNVKFDASNNRNEKASILIEACKLFNPSSSQQMSDLLFEKMRVPINAARSKKTGKYSTNKLVLEKIIESRLVPQKQKDICKKLLAIRGESKFLSTYIRVKLDEDNRYRMHYKQQGVKTAPGRLSCEHTQWGTGGNMQNQPIKSRAMFIAPPDYVFGYIDGSQAEARFVGWDAGIESWIEDFEKARLNPGTFDCHRSLAAKIFNVEYDQVPEKDFDERDQPTMRYLGKRARHGLNYRMMPQTFAERTNISLAQAHRVFEAYHRETPELKTWWKRLEQEVVESKRKYGYGTLSNPYGRRLYIPEALTEEALKSIVAFRPQSTIGDLLQETWYRSHEDDDWPTGKAKILINVHDSLTFIAHKDVAKTALRIMVKHAERPLTIGGRPLIIPAEAKLSYPDEMGIHRWSNLKGVVL